MGALSARGGVGGRWLVFWRPFEPRAAPPLTLLAQTQPQEAGDRVYMLGRGPARRWRRSDSPKSLSGQPGALRSSWRTDERASEVEEQP